MKFAPVLLVAIGIVGIAAWLAPQLPSPLSTASPDSAPNDPQLAVLHNEHRGAGQVTLIRAPNGHFYADVSLGRGASANMLVDTGASVVALTAEDGRALGVNWRANDVQVVARGASGDVYGVRTRLDRVAVGEIEVRDVDAVVIPEGLPHSLLGQSFLSEVGRIEVRQDAMVLNGG